MYSATGPCGMKGISSGPGLAQLLGQAGFWSPTTNTTNIVSFWPMILALGSHAVKTDCNQIMQIYTPFCFNTSLILARTRRDTSLGGKVASTTNHLSGVWLASDRNP